ncbi:MAG: helix-turn-helix transcriptional regulator [Chitinophagales bacterium]|nr:helix-turn-helix transcriptional regulator [Chitinophagales bacterium]
MSSLITTKAEAIFYSISHIDDYEQLDEESKKQYFSFLNEYANSQNSVLMILKKVSLDYEFITSNFYHFWGLNPSESINSFKSFFPLIMENVQSLAECIKVHEELFNNATEDEKSYFSSTFFGARVNTLNGTPARLVWHVVPMILNGHRQSKILLSYQKEITHLVEGDIYWFRIDTGKRIFTWYSNQKIVKEKEIISRAELSCIRYWTAGLSSSEIAKTLFISVNTVNNHFKAVRNRLGLRNNTAIVEICHLLNISTSNI